MPERNCRFCGTHLGQTFADLGMSPLSNSYIPAGRENQGEIFYPLHAYVCGACWLVQLEEFESRENIFGDYAYFSSFSDSWLKHCAGYAGEMVRRFGLGSDSQVVEVASNDGYLLQYFKQHGVRILGVEPAANVAAVAVGRGIPSEVAFFGERTAGQLRSRGFASDLMAANNVLAHVPDINDFVAGFVILLKKSGVATFEFPHLLNLVRGMQFDTIYHEHFSYPSLSSVINVFKTNGLEVFDVEEIPTHGGSLRVYAQRSDSPTHPVQASVQQLVDKEIAEGMQTRDFYASFQPLADKVTFDLVSFLIKCREENKTVIGYGAAAKGNTLLNYAGIRPNLLSCVYDASPAKAGNFLPGSHIPIYPAADFPKHHSDYVLILPWNLTDEIMNLYPQVFERGGKWVTAIPSLKVHSR